MQLHLFLPCAAGVETYLAQEAKRITGLSDDDIHTFRAGVMLRASWRDALLLNLHSRLAQRVLIELSYTPYRQEQDLYDAAANVAWELWFTPKQSFKIDITAQHSPLKSLNFAALKIKDAIADRFRHKTGVRPDVNTQWPDARIFAHLTVDHVSLYIDTSGEPLFKRGWRADKGDAPLKETLAAAMLAASGWSQGDGTPDNPDGWCAQGVPLYDPCCGSGTIAVEAAQIACNIAPGSMRRFGFEKLVPFQAHVWQGLLNTAREQEHAPSAPVFGSDVAFRMVDFAQRNAERAGVAHAVQLRGGDALQRMPPSEAAGVMLVNPPYGERIEAAGVAGVARLGARELTQTEDGGDFFAQLATHWKKNYPGWTAWMLTPDLKLPGRMRFKESRRVPMWNGPIECRMFRFDLRAGSMRNKTP
ncbi:MAG: THUMP domain-containing class I SAM-dependent RNA methyltransferase [Limnohabitans sp.]|jgi:putative N6-adenine-specific DNA methylase